MSCIMKWLSPNLQDLEIYQEIDHLFCNFYISDDELKSNLTIFPLYFSTRSDDGDTISVDWYSKLSWKDINFGDWNTQEVVFDSTLSSNPIDKFYSEIYLLKILRNIDINEDGYNAWKNIINPYFGTSEIQRYLLKISPYTGKYFEWYDYDYPIFTYGFVFDSLPSNYKTQLDAFIKLSNIYRNIESDFYSIQDDKLYCSLIADEKPLDECFLDSPDGKIFDGVLLLFTDIVKKITDEYNYFNKQFLTKIKSEYLLGWFNYQDVLDEYILDVTEDKYLWKQRTVYQPSRYVSVNPGFFASLSDKWIGFWEPYQSWENIEFDKLIERQYTPEIITWDENYTWEDTILFKGKISNFDELKKTKTTNNIILDVNLSFYNPQILKIHKIEKVY